MEDLRVLNPFRLGFGLMRLPKNPDGSIDIPQQAALISIRHMYTTTA